MLTETRCSTSRSAQCSRSCRGTFRSGRSFASPRRRYAPATSGILKHASNVPQCALAIEDLFTSAGAPAGVFQTLLVGSDRVDAIIADERIAAVTLTGSEPAGRHVAGTAGKNLKKTVLELGGSDPFIVMASADIAKAADVAVKARMINNGQSCIAAKRFIVHERSPSEFTDRFVERYAIAPRRRSDASPTPTSARSRRADRRRPGEAGDRERSSWRDEFSPAASESPAPGNYFEPTVLDRHPRRLASVSGGAVRPRCVAVPRARPRRCDSHRERHELRARRAPRGPVTTLKHDRFIRDLEAGTVFINGMVASDPRFPFGGVKHSGYGRELGPWGLREFVNIKTVRRQAAPSTHTE